MLPTLNVNHYQHMPHECIFLLLLLQYFWTFYEKMYQDNRNPLHYETFLLSKIHNPDFKAQIALTMYTTIPNCNYCLTIFAKALIFLA